MVKLGLLCGVLLSQTLAAADTSPEGNARCSERVFSALINKLPSAAQSKAADPKAALGELLTGPDFIENFSKFVNTSFNDDAGELPSQDSAYYLAKYILENRKPWAELFTGAYDLRITRPGAQETVAVIEAPNGLGYFRSRPWMVRYAGNEPQGIRINSAYRIMNNVVGLTLTATTNAPDADITAKGREATACRSCHYDSWSALDKVASVLGTVNNSGNAPVFTPPDGVPKEILGGIMVKDDRELVQALVASENFSFNACRLAFTYLYGRQETQCEAKVFDQCVVAFKKSGMIQDGLSALVNDANFCQ